MELKLENITKKYGEKKALDRVNAVFQEGIYGILGANGAGKSTMMNILTDNISFDEGTITLDGENIFQMGKRYRKLLGYMPQQQCFYENFTFRRFLGYLAALKGMKKEQVNRRIEEVASQVKLVDVLDKRLGGFSGGMRQRAFIAQAILDDPKILILDEPTAGLDPKERIRIRNLISKLATDKIVLIATHVVQDIEFISKEILIVKEGAFLYQDTPIHLQNLLQGQVYEITVGMDELESVMQQYTTSNLYQNGKQAIVRVISETKPVHTSCQEVMPTLEDVFLKLFGNEE